MKFKNLSKLLHNQVSLIIISCWPLSILLLLASMMPTSLCILFTLLCITLSLKPVCVNGLVTMPVFFMKIATNYMIHLVKISQTTHKWPSLPELISCGPTIVAGHGTTTVNVLYLPLVRNPLHSEKMIPWIDGKII